MRTAPSRKLLTRVDVVRIPTSEEDRVRMADLITACIFVEFARCHLELMTNGLQATQRLTKNANELILSLEHAGVMWEASAYIATIRDRYAINSDGIEKESARTILRECGRKKPDHVGLRMLSKLRSNASSHFNLKAARSALAEQFDDLASSPLLISEEPTPHRTTSPIALKALLLYCYKSAIQNDELETVQQQVADACADILHVLIHIQNVLSDGLEQYLHRSCEGDLVTLPPA